MTTLSNLFKAANITALVAWLALFAFPWWPAAARAGVLTTVVALLCALYVWLLFFARHLDAAGVRPRGNFRSLDGVMRLFTSPRVVLAGWVHYLAFDLMVGLFIVTDAARLGIAHLWLLPALFLTLMFGPLGLLVYLAMRVAMGAGMPVVLPI